MTENIRSAAIKFMSNGKEVIIEGKTHFKCFLEAVEQGELK